MEIARGAEAVLTKSEEGVLKERVPKGYRHPDLDVRMRKQRTKSEARIMKKAASAGVPVPSVEVIDEYTLKIEEIDGDVLADIEVTPEIAESIGKIVAKLHEADIIHGDLTTSNMILSDDIWLIDFGLAFHSKRLEDKAVDVHVFKQALESKHYKTYDEALVGFLKGYKHADVLQQLEIVESRGKNKK